MPLLVTRSKIMLIPNKHSGYIAGIRLYPGGGKGGGEYDPQIGAALKKQVGIADKMSEFVMRAYDENQPMLKELQALNGKVIEQQMGMADKASERADDAYGFYKNVGRPMVTQSIEEAKNWDSQGNLDAARGRASADVTSAFDGAQKAQSRQLSRMGVNPNSGKMLALNNQMTIQKAAATAGAQGSAVENRKNQAVGMRQQASNLGSGFAAQSSQGMGQAGGFGASAAGIGGNNLNQGMSVQNQAVSGMNAVGGMYGNNAAGYQNLGNAGDQRSANSAAGWGSLAGMGMSMMNFADGGKINGPGTGTSDSVPAVNTSSGQPIRLSNGEYIVSADTVRAKGTEFFDRLQQKHHKPVNVGRKV